MKQVLQNLKNGKTYVEELPAPAPSSHHVYIETTNTLISTGTEKMLVDFGRSGWIGKVRQQPDKVRMVLDKVKTDGVVATYESVQSKLDQPLPLGYCQVGVVLNPGAADTLSVGDRVVSNGPHASFVRVSPNLCCKIPDNVTDEEAAFTVLGAIALQGVRLAQPTLGETFVVMGLGLIGLLTVQLLRAAGCKVIAVDFDSQKLAQAEKYQAIPVLVGNDSDVVQAVLLANNGQECDGVLMTLSTDKDAPVSQAAHMCRKRGRIVLVGVTGLALSRADFYEKELSFQVSCSYGPGRYDPLYEEAAQDYPRAFVRWTAQRNMQAFLDMISLGNILVGDLISHRFSIEDASLAYDLVAQGSTGLGVLIQFKVPEAELTSVPQQTITYGPLSFISLSQKKGVTLGVVGAGNYAQRILLPSFKKVGVLCHTVCSSGGVSAATAARKFGFAFGTSSPDELFGASDVNTVVVATRHNTHASYVIRGLRAGKNVFVEKPLALTHEEIDQIESFYLKASQDRQNLPLLMVGFNRRFSPFVEKMKTLMERDGAAKTIVMTINAGHIPQNHWTQNKEVGGGRLVGEACHFIDLARFLIGRKIVDFSVQVLGRSIQGGLSDCATITLSFEEGSMATIHYLSTGHKSFPKERIEVFCGGKILQLDNFKKLKAYGWSKFKTMWTFRQDKGQNQMVKRFCDSILENKGFPIPLEEIVEVARVTLQVAEKAE